MKFHLLAHLFLVVLLSACQSIEWSTNDSLHGLQWRDRTAYVDGLDVVLAGDRSSAQETIRQVRDLRAELTSQFGRSLGPMTWVSMGPRDAALATTPEAMVALFGGPALGQAPMMHQSSSMPDNEPGSRPLTEAEQAQMMEWMIRAQAAYLDFEKTSLHFPESIAGHSEGAFLYPTNSGVKGVASDLIDLTLSTREFSIVESMAIRLMRGKIINQLSDTLIQQRQEALHDWLSQELDLATTGSEPQTAQLDRILGLETRAPKRKQRTMSMDEFMAEPTTIFPEDQTAIAIDWTEDQVKVTLDGTLDTRATIMNGMPVDRRMGYAPGMLFIWSQGSFERDELDYLFDQLDNSRGRILIRASSHGFAAAIATLYAVERQALTSSAAQLLWANYDMPPIQVISYAGLRKFFRHTK